MIEITPDVNFFLDATRRRDSMAEAVETANDRMRALQGIAALGRRSGLVLHTGEHVLSNIESALASPEASRRGPTRDPWTRKDITNFVDFVRSVVTATGGRVDCDTVSHNQALGLFAAAGAPDAEDFQMLTLADRSPATVLATSDGPLASMGSFGSVDIWSSDEVMDELRANIRRLQGR